MENMNVIPLQVLLDAAKHEHAQSLRNAIVRTRIKMMAEEVFPMNRPFLFQEAA